MQRGAQTAGHFGTNGKFWELWQAFGVNGKDRRLFFSFYL